MEEENKIILFGPKDGKSLRKLYPEIAATKEFKELSGENLLFAWHIGNPSSPIEFSIPETTRYTLAASICFPNDKIKRKQFSEMSNIPEDVKIAIDKMTKFSPDARLVSKRMVQTMFSNFQKMVNVDEKEFYVENKDGVIQPDWTAKKQYIDSCTKIAEALPGLIKQIEEGFGIEENKKSGESTMKAIDKFHQDTQK